VVSACYHNGKVGEEVSAIIGKQRNLERRFEDIISNYQDDGKEIDTYKTVRVWLCVGKKFPIFFV